MVLFEGISPPNRPLRDVLAAENHKKAYDWLVAYKGDVNQKMIFKIHEILSKDILNKYESGKFRQVQVYIRGSSDIPPRADAVEKEIIELVRWYKFNKRKYHPVVVAAFMHINFEKTHPFVDFNGRTGRLLMNFILMKNNLPPVDIRNKDRMKYYEAIKSGIHENLNPFVKLIIKYLKEMENNS
jgi:Fic family protein